MNYRIASFNMHNFSLEKKDLDRIARIIIENQIDIVAMQEVLAEGKGITGIPLKEGSTKKLALEKSLIGRLGPHWESCWGDPQTKSKFYPYLGNDKRGEGYAFLWNTKKFELLKDEYNRFIYPTMTSQPIKADCKENPGFQHTKSYGADAVCELKLYDVFTTEKENQYRVTAKVNYAPIHVGDVCALIVGEQPTYKTITVLQIGIGDRQWTEKEPDKVTTLIVSSNVEYGSELSNQRFIFVKQ